MSRKVISLSLPIELLDSVDEHYLTTGYASLSEYIRELIRNDLRQNGKMRDPNDTRRIRINDNRYRKPQR